MMNSKTYERVREVFDRASDLPETDRAAYLDSACADDDAVRKEVESLLLLAPDDAGLSLVGVMRFVKEPDAAMPERIGSYRVLSLLGEGGMGVVYKAEQDSPRREVALKVIKPGMDSRAVIARFEQEREALAMMDHANVARVFDGGVTPEGRPYFVMEHVAGVPITEYCDAARLTIKERLELFVPVCEAVQHAHQKGVIHHDLKPGNILVRVENGNGISIAVPKVIDFGVAKAISHSRSGNAASTLDGQIIGTPEYMSPEQAHVGAPDIDTRTDVYALGVVLYELLTGVLPVDWGTAWEKGLVEVQRIIRDEESPKPSTRLTSLAGDIAAGIAQSRKIEPVRLTRELRRELEWIPLKALRKDRDQRYPSPADLARDIRNYLDGLPLEAGPESAAYRARKYVRKHRFAVTAVAAVFVALVVGLAGTLWQARVAREAARIAEERRLENEQLLEFQSMQFRGIDPQTMGTRLRMKIVADVAVSLENTGFSASEIAAKRAELVALLDRVNPTTIALDIFAQSILENAVKAMDGFDDQPRLKAQMLQTLATTLMGFGFLDRAAKPQADAVGILRGAFGDNDPDTQAAVANMAALLRAQGHSSEAEPLLRQVLEAIRREKGENDPDTLTSMNNVGIVLAEQGKLQEAEPYLRNALEGRKRILGDNDAATLTSIDGIGTLLYYQSKFTEAEPYLREALEGRRRVLGNEDQETLASLNNLGSMLQSLGRLSEAEPLLREALETRRRVYGDDNPYTLDSIASFGGFLEEWNKPDEAEPYYREALEGKRRLYGSNNARTLTALSNLGTLLQGQNKLAEAEPYVRESLELRRRLLGSENTQTVESINNMGVLLLNQGKLAEAEPLLIEALEKYRRLAGNEDVETLRSVSNLAVVLFRQGKLAQAEPLFREAIAGRERVLTKSHWSVAASRLGLGRVLTGLNRHAEAEEALIETERVLASAEGVPQGVHRKSIEAIIALYESWEKAEPGKGHGDKAAAWKAKLESAK